MKGKEDERGQQRPPAAKRRGAGIEPPNPYDRERREWDLEQCEHDPDFADPLRIVPTEFYDDQSRSIITENDSPDLRFRFSLNPYRGCEHGCSYCYARPYHEKLGLNAGLDFETKIMVKRDAPKLLREFLARSGWHCEPIVMSGVTDCYQPVERSLEITRRCLEVMLEARQPVELITKNRLILRDLDLLGELAKLSLVHVNLAVTSLDADLARKMEPRTSPPAGRIEAIRGLAEAGVPVRVLVAPVVPGLTDTEIPLILKAAKEAGARHAGYTLLRLPGNVLPIFLDWLERVMPEKKALVESRIQATREGKLNDARFGSRMRGKGILADQIQTMFLLFRKRYGLEKALPPLETTKFRTPQAPNGQQFLF